MMARCLGMVLVALSLFSSGCCCMSGGPCGQPACCLCLPHLPKPIVWDGCCNECGPGPCESCADRCGGCQTCGIFGHGGLLPGLRGDWTCGKGCADIYVSEWVSDPPDCCDPCDKCYGQFTGPHGYCCLGPFQRILAGIHGYKYCAAPECGPWRPIFGHCGHGPGYGSSCGCGDVGCSTCGGGGAPHGGEVYYDNQPGQAVPRPAPTTMRSQGNVPTPTATEETSILEENWEAPRGRAEPGKPIHSAQQPRNQVSGRYPANHQQQSQQLSPAQLAARRAAQQRSNTVGGVRAANYQR